MSTATHRPRGYIHTYSPHRKTQVLLERVQAVLEEYVDLLPLTLRQIFYRLVGKYDFPKRENHYKRLGNHISNARRAGWIPFEAIRDDGVMGGPPELHFTDKADFCHYLTWYANHAELDALVVQDVNVELLCEAAGMVPQMQGVATPYSVPVYSSGGFDSLTAKKDLVDRLKRDGRPAIVLHVGDWDPSGESMFDALGEDVTAFLAYDAPHLGVEFRRVALTSGQVARYDLPTAPPKKSDSRSGGWSETCQLEAMPPDVLSRVVKDALEDVLDGDLARDRRSASEGFRRDLLERLGNGETLG